MATKEEYTKTEKKNGGAPQKKHIDKKKSPSCGHIYYIKQ